LLDGLALEERREPPKPKTRDSAGKLAAAYHGDAKPVPPRHKTPAPAPAVIVAGSEAITEEDREKDPPAPEPKPAPRMRAETTAPPKPAASPREKMVAFIAPALVVGLAGGGVLYYRHASAPSPRRVEVPMQTLPPRVEVPEVAPPSVPVESLDVAPDPTTADPVSTTTVTSARGPAPAPKAKASSKPGVAPPPDFEDLKQKIQH
jgi:hypothetical protein